MRAENIKREALRLKAEYKTVCPREICAALGIRICEIPMGQHEQSCKGFLMHYARCRTAVVNSCLCSDVQGIILTHELGHAVLHADSGIQTFREMSYLDDASHMELEANIFAAEFLLDDDELLSTANEHQDFFRLASAMGVPPEFLDFKLRLMQREGYDVVPPLIAKSDFLKRDISLPLD